MDAATPHRDPLCYTIPLSASSLLPPLASPAPSSCIPSHQVSHAPSQIPLSPVDNGIVPMEQGGLEQEQDLQEVVVPVLRPEPSSSSKKKEESGKTCGETQRADDARVERQITSEIHMHQRDTSKVPISETVGGKRSLSHGSESSRARKDAKIINAKVEMTQLKNSKTPRRKMSPIVSRSPIMNMIARNKAQSHAGTSKSPKLHARSPNLHPRSPNQAGTSRSPNLHDLSPTLAHGTPTTSDELPPTATNGSKRKPQKLTSIVWNDAEPIYIDGLLTQGRCKYCNTVFPASKVSGSSQLARHLKVCEVKCSMDGVVQQIRTSDEIDPDWKFDQQAARFELVKLIVLHGVTPSESALCKF